jgi:hypothetical protein
MNDGHVLGEYTLCGELSPFTYQTEGLLLGQEEHFFGAILTCEYTAAIYIPIGTISNSSHIHDIYFINSFHSTRI